MKPPPDTTPGGNAPRNTSAAEDAEQTGLPLLRTWRAVYAFVLACFVVCVALLAALTLLFQ